MDNNINAPTILIFDSGVGGISVYSEIKARMPDANYIYLFDNKAYPYGELAKDKLVFRVNALIPDIVKKHSVDIVVVACNTASTVVLPSLRSTLNIPVVGVVPAIKPASTLAVKALGLIATPATIKREYTHDLIKNFSHNIPVKLLGSTKLVDMAEDKLRGEPVDLEVLADILNGLKGKIDVAVLGCTHFPLIKEEIGEILGKNVQLIDSGIAIAKRVQFLLKEQYLDLGSENSKNSLKHIAYSSATPYKEAALNIAFKEFGFKAIEMILSRDV